MLFSETIYNRLCKNSGREKGTLCEQLFFSVGLCFVVEALLEFFQMSNTKQKPTANGPHSIYCLTEAYQKSYVNGILDKFLDEFVFIGDDDMSLSKDGIWCYGVNIIRSFMVLADIKDALPLANTCLPFGNCCWFIFFQILVLPNFQLKCSLTSCSAMFCCQKPTSYPGSFCEGKTLVSAGHVIS